MANREIFLDRRDKLKGEGKVELPLNIDTKKYLLAKLSFWDILIILPGALITASLIFMFKKLDMLSQGSVIMSFLPVALLTVFQVIKHPIRTNLPFLKYRVFWKMKYSNRKKDFYYTKGDIDMGKNDEDSRKQLGIKNVFSGCYETSDNRFVKVIEVSSINLSLMNDSEKDSIYDSYRSFINELSILKDFQTAQIAQPINLSQYLLFVESSTVNETNINKKILINSYKRYTEKIQKSRKMVSRKRYFILDTEISSDREKSLMELDKKASIIQTKIENMLLGQTKLDAKILKNDELLKLLYTCIDYDNALSIGDHIINRANNKVSISLGEKTAKDIIKTFERQLKDSIN